MDHLDKSIEKVESLLSTAGNKQSIELNAELTMLLAMKKEIQNGISSYGSYFDMT
jgi:hypothetical protein